MFARAAEHLPAVAVQNLRKRETAVEIQIQLLDLERQLAAKRRKGGSGADVQKLEAQIQLLRTRRDASPFLWEVEGKEDPELRALLRKVQEEIRAKGGEVGDVGETVTIREEARSSDGSPGCPC